MSKYMLMSDQHLTDKAVIVRARKHGGARKLVGFKRSGMEVLLSK